MEATESSRLVNFPEPPFGNGARNSPSGVKGAVGRLFQRLADGLQQQLLHDEIGVGVGVAAIGGEARQHLGRGLPADAPAAIVVLAEEFGMVEGPILGDGVPHEDHLGEVAALGNALVVSLVAIEPEPILL